MVREVLCTENLDHRLDYFATALLRHKIVWSHTRVHHPKSVNQRFLPILSALVVHFGNLLADNNFYVSAGDRYLRLDSFVQRIQLRV